MATRSYYYIRNDSQQDRLTLSLSDGAMMIPEHSIAYAIGTFREKQRSLFPIIESLRLNPRLAAPDFQFWD